MTTARSLIVGLVSLLITAGPTRSAENSGYRCNADADCEYPGCNDAPCTGQESDEFCIQGVWAIKCVSLSDHPAASKNVIVGRQDKC